MNRHFYGASYIRSTTQPVGSKSSRVLQTSGRNSDQFIPEHADCLSVVRRQHQSRWLLHNSHRGWRIPAPLEYQNALMARFHLPTAGIPPRPSSISSSHKQLRRHSGVGHALRYFQKPEGVQGSMRVRELARRSLRRHARVSRRSFARSGEARASSFLADVHRLFKTVGVHRFEKTAVEQSVNRTRVLEEVR